MKYPNSRKELLIENHFGTQVEDSYRWMEDESNENLATWINEQDALTRDYLQGIAKRDDMKARLKELYNYSKYRMVKFVEEKLIYEYNDGLQNQGVYYIQDGLDGEAKVLVDPNELSEDGTVAVHFGGHSKDGRYLAYLQANAGSDWHVIHIIDLTTLEVIEDKIEWVKFTAVSWQADGFYYSAFEAPEEGKVLSEQNANQKIKYHKLGTPQSEDVVIYEDRDNPLRYHRISVSKDEATLILSSFQGTYGSEIRVNSAATNGEFKVIFDGFENSRGYFGSIDEYLYFLSDEDAKNRQVIRVNANNLETDIVVAESKNTIENVHLQKEKLIVEQLEDVQSRLKIYDKEGNFENDLTLPGIGTPFNFISSDSYDEVFFGFTSYLTPASYYSFTLEKLQPKLFKGAEVNFNADDFVTEQIFTKSKDGTMVPSFVTYKKGLELNGQNPTLLYAYGGFNISLKPAFSPAFMYFMEQGGVYVVANIRGGSEYGEAWHRDGMLFNKQNVFDDFIRVGEDLIERKYTSKNHLAVMGGSNGGLLIGAVVNQRPDLFKVALPAVGVMDMIRYHKFTIGWGWVVEYGNPEEEEHFNNIIKYSPLHNIEAKDYPATLVFTADHDDRVVPAHSFKYISRLQEMNTSDNPVLIRIDKNAGHGAGKSTAKLIDEAADRFAFIFNNM